MAVFNRMPGPGSTPCLRTSVAARQLSARRKLYLETLEVRRLLNADAPSLAFQGGLTELGDSFQNGQFRQPDAHLSASELRSLLIAGAKNQASGSDSHGLIDALGAIPRSRAHYGC